MSDNGGNDDFPSSSSSERVLELERDALNFAQMAVEHDSLKKNHSAIFYYTEAAQALLCAAMSGSTKQNLLEKANEYILRAEELKKVDSDAQECQKKRAISSSDADRAQFLLKEAFEEDEAGSHATALEMYQEGIALLIKIRNETTDATQKTKMESLARMALERAEHLKSMLKSTTASPTKSTSTVADTTAKLKFKPLGDNPFGERTPAGRAGVAAGAGKVPRIHGTDGYTTEEVAVLRATTYINGREYVPFIDSADLRERFAFPVAYSEPLLALSAKQQRSLAGWRRPDELTAEPCMIMLISAYSIRQTIVSDCSFVASMAIAAQYERRFKKQLVTNVIYPQNRRGEPVYNACGKYMVKLHLNGVWRKVIVDDRLPVARDGELLCSYSNNRQELWVSLLEKAYMKVMGGYDFPGSNSNIDLHALTGWIPERIAIRPGSRNFDKDKEFRKLLDRFHKGHCLVTVATGELSERDADRAGLVPCHAYAMLDVREVFGQRLFMLKNPWNHLSWRGNYSQQDVAHWTDELQRTLAYDRHSAALHDNGVFWIDYESLCHFFDVFYVNWDPDLFPYTTCHHHEWQARSGPRKDIYSMSDNPQYLLEVRANTPSPVWVHLIRHIVDKEDFANNREFIALVVYKDIPSRRVCYPNEPAPLKDGARVNSPHYLVKLVQQAGTCRYHLVVSQYEKAHTIRYTVRAYSTVPLTLNRIIDPWRFEKQLSGAWQGVTAGGCSNNRATYDKNPCYQIKLDNFEVDNHIMIELRAPKEYSAGFDIVTVEARNPTAVNNFIKKSSGDFRRGYVVLELTQFSGGIYNIIPCTYSAGQEGPFLLDISSVRAITVCKL